AIRFCWMQAAVLPVAVRKAHVVQQVGPQDGGQAAYALVGPVGITSPIGRQTGDAQRRKRFVPVVRVTDESTVLLAQPKIEPCADLSAIERTRSDPAKLRELRRQRLHAENSVLIIALEI